MKLMRQILFGLTLLSLTLFISSCNKTNYQSKQGQGYVGDDYEVKAPKILKAALNPIDPINTTVDLEIKWDGPPLESGETIYLTINSPKFDLEYETDLDGATSFTVPASDLASIETDLLTFWLARERVKEHLGQFGSGGLLTTRYLDIRTVAVL